MSRGRPFNADTARKAGKKSVEAKTVYKSLNADLREQATPERIAKINNRLLSMAEHGNLKAYELIRDGLGEKPRETSYGTDDGVEVINDAPPG